MVIYVLYVLITAEVVLYLEMHPMLFRMGQYISYICPKVPYVAVRFPMCHISITNVLVRA